MKPGYMFRFFIAGLVLTLDVFCTKAAVSCCINHGITYALHQDENIASQPHQQSVTAGTSINRAPAAIGLTVTNFESRIALLTWTTTNPGIPGTYHIERKTATGGYIELATLPHTAPLTYNDTISYPYCTPTLFIYHIFFVSNSGTDDAISPDYVSVTLSDLTKPAELNNVNVSLMQTSSGYNPRLSWDRITNDAIAGYKIQQYNGFSWGTIGTADADSGNFTHSFTDACSATSRYVVRSIDGCSNESDQKLYEDIFVQTLHLKAEEPSNCDKAIKLTWNSYKKIPGGIGGYKITRCEGSKNETFSVAATDTTYTDSYNLKTGQTYLYSVTEISANGLYTSSSCQQVHVFNSVNIPDVYITQVSVEQDRFIRVNYQITPPNPVVKLILERSNNGTSDFRKIDSLYTTSGTVPPLFFIDDTTANVHAGSYYYRFIAFNACGDEVLSANISRSIWLQCDSQDAENRTQWNSYETWMHGVQDYTLYRSVDGAPPGGKIITSQASATSYTDPVSGIDPAKLVCYWVVANENLTTAISKSNTCCILKEPAVFMPNAFHPGSAMNNVLRPVNDIAFADQQSFRLIIFNRWGQQLCETTDMTRGWDGTVNGQISPAGMYSYLLTYNSKDGKPYTKRGTALLIR